MHKLILLLAVCFITVVHSQNANDELRSKLSYALFEKPGNANDSIDVSINTRNSKELISTKNPFRVLRIVSPVIVVVRIKREDLKRIALSKEIVFISEQHMPKEELTTGAYDLSLNRINFAHSRLPLLAGDSLNSSIKERLFDTTDIDLRGRIFKTGLENSTLTAHAGSMVTIIAGGANSSPFAKGVAWQSNVSSASFSNLFADADSIFQKNKITVQNHSYGTTVENFYGNEAVSYDAQANRIQTLLHVFSAGNSGNVTNTNGPYAGVQEFANLSGNFKHAKNIIAVGSIDSAGGLMPLSSKGPAYDGRIKPEIMAYGEDGSSGAAALVSGTALLVQDAYKKMHGGILPMSSLVKSVLLNSADDIGNQYIDYASGFGSLNAFKALSTINENRIIENTINPSEIKNFNLVVPNGTSQVKITIAWNDPAASVNAPKALVNDLDMQLKFPSTGENWLPWVLDPSASLTALQSPAQRKTDTLNNIEQVTIDNPVAGSYVIEVRGSRVNPGGQPFSIAYQFDTANTFYWTYPTSKDPLIAGNTHWLRWETNLVGQGQIEYATTANNWRTVGTVADLSKKYFRWTLPDTVTAALLRMKIQASGGIFVSDSFTISPQLNMQVGFNCADSFLLYWNSLPVASYNLLKMGSKYLETVSQTADTSVLFRKSQQPAVYYSVAPLIGNKEGIKSNTINYASLANDCYIKSFFLQNQTASAAYFAAEIGTLFNVDQVSLQKLNDGSFVTIKTISNPSILQFNFSDFPLSQGENHYRLAVRLKNGQLIYSTVEFVFYLPSRPVVLYPNPVMQNSVLKLLTNESGRYTLQLVDNYGRIVHQQLLARTLTEIPAMFFAKGFYIARIIDRDGKPFSEKIIIE